MGYSKHCLLFFKTRSCFKFWLILLFLINVYWKSLSLLFAPIYNVSKRIWKPRFLWWKLFCESGDKLMKTIFLPRYSINYLINTNVAPTINFFKYHLSILIYPIRFIDFIEFKWGGVPTAIDQRRISHWLHKKWSFPWRTSSVFFRFLWPT